MAGIARTFPRAAELVRWLTLARDLQRRKARERQQLFVCEGVRAAEELLRSPLAVRGAVVSPTLAAAARGETLRATMEARAIPTMEVDEREFATAASTESPQGVLLIAQMPRVTLDVLALPPRARLLVLDAIQDPGNVGTMLRTGAAFGVAATLALPGTVDLWNAKVVRSAMGALFHRPAVSCTWEELDVFLLSRSVTMWGADSSGERADASLTAAAPELLALALGNEGAGLSAAARARAARLVTVPIDPEVESLNVAVAAGILLHLLRS